MRRRCSAGGIVLGVGVGVSVWAAGWAGCSVENDYELLSFFFDGVPEPGSLESGGGLFGGGSRTLYTHEPYATESCLECHPNPSQMQLSRDDSSVCLKCHAEIPDQYAIMHGAVIGNACLWCHDPHISTNAALLREPAPALCIQCHGDEAKTGPSSAHVSAETECLSCHAGHGGNDAYFLRDLLLGDDNDSVEDDRDAEDDRNDDKNNDPGVNADSGVSGADGP